jgi:tetratricopeptide (TPR) repeat protein
MVPKSLADKLREGRVIPFVGAGVSRAVLRQDGHPLFPSWFELLQATARRLEAEQKPKVARYVESAIEQEPPEYLNAAQKAREQLGGTWADFLRSQLDPPSEEADSGSLALARAVWGLGSPLIVTTNYDRVLLWACPEQHRNEVRLWDIENKAEQAQLLQDGKVSRPTIWHLHGQIGNAADLILTPDGYRQLYPSTGETEQQYRTALTTLRTLLASRSLLFIGFSLDDAAFGVQLKGVSEVFEGNTGPHYVLVRERDSHRLKEQGLPVELITFEEFGTPLLDLIQYLGEIAKESQPRSVAPAAEKGVAREAIPTQSSPVASYSPENRPFFVPFRPKGDRMVGREEALRRVREQLVRGTPTAIGQTAAFQGLGGLGKTQLAIEYAYEFGGQYPNGVIWLTVDQDIPAQLTRLAVEARWVAPESGNEATIAIARNRLRSYPDCLLIFDNLEDAAVIEPYLPPAGVDVHLLATSREEQPLFTAVAIGTLNQATSVALLSQEAGRPFHDDEDEAAARAVATELGGLPLALEMAGAYVRRRYLSWVQYKELLDSRPREVLQSRSFPSFTRHDADLYATLQVSQGIFEEEPALREVLDVLTWSGSAPMGVSLLAAVLQRQPADLYGALGLGVVLRLLEKPTDEARYGIHRLLRKVRQEEDSPLAERTAWLEEVTRNLGDWFAERRREFLNLAAYEAEIDHLSAWQKHAQGLSISQASRLLWLHAYPASHRGQYQEAHEEVSRALTLYKSGTVEDQELEAWLWSDLGTTNSYLGHFGKALDCAQRGYEIRCKLLGERHEDVAISLSEIARHHQHLGDSRKALKLHSRVLEMRRSLLGMRHADVAESLANIAIAHQYLGDTKQALQLLSQALEMSRSLLGERHPTVAMYITSLANVYQDLRDARQAVRLHSEALEMLRSLFGESHPNIAATLDNLAIAISASGDEEQAFELHSQSLEMRRRLLGEQHPDIAKSLSNLAFCHQFLGDREQAQQLHSQALTIRRSLLGDRHPLTCESVINTAKSMIRLNRRDEAYRLIEPYLKDPPSQSDIKDKLKSIERELRSKPILRGFRQPPRIGSPKKSRK